MRLNRIVDTEATGLVGVQPCRRQDGVWIVVIGIAIGYQRTSTLVRIDQQARHVLQIVDLGGGGDPLVVNVIVRKVPIVEGLFFGRGVV